MKKFKKIICLALAMVMVMAMSITAFADENTESSNTATLKIDISGISTRESSEIKVYKLATIDTENNDLVVEDWAKTVYYEGVDADADWVKALDEIPAATKEASLIAKKASNNAASVTIEGLPGGIYYVTMSGETVRYNSMVAKAYSVSDAGVYLAADATVTAKGESSDVDKTASDEFVKAGQTVDFEITTTIPYNLKSYKVYDKMTNLENVTDIKVTVDGTEVNDVEFKEESEGLYVADLANYLSKSGSTVVITYTATVSGDDGYVNVAYDNKNGTDGDKTTVEGHTGDITLTKFDANDKDKTLEGAGFEVSHKDNVLSFVKTADGEYKLAEADDTNTVTTVFTGKEGTLKVTGLEEGEYTFHEVQAPEGYAINTTDLTVEIKDKDADGNYVTENVHVNGEAVYFFDTTLSSLPFTGGMGTTIFTVLGVVIMAAAAALYFATKKNAAK